MRNTQSFYTHTHTHTHTSATLCGGTNTPINLGFLLLNDTYGGRAQAKNQHTFAPWEGVGGTNTPIRKTQNKTL